jgi:hypothetical protein
MLLEEFCEDSSFLNLGSIYWVDGCKRNFWWGILKTLCRNFIMIQQTSWHIKLELGCNQRKRYIHKINLLSWFESIIPNRCRYKVHHTWLLWKHIRFNCWRWSERSAL